MYHYDCSRHVYLSHSIPFVFDPFLITTFHDEGQKTLGMRSIDLAPSYLEQKTIPATRECHKYTHIHANYRRLVNVL